MKLKIMHPGGIATAVVDDDASLEEIRRVIYLATHIEEGNGNGRVKLRENPGTMDAVVSF